MSNVGFFTITSAALRNSSDAGGGGDLQYCHAYDKQLEATEFLWSILYLEYNTLQC